MTLRLERGAAGPAPAASLPVSTKSQSPAASPPTPRFAELLHRFAKHIEAGESVVNRALHGDLGALDSRGLIAVQAGIYHYTEGVELAGRLIDRATGALRTVLQPGGH